MLAKKVCFRELTWCGVMQAVDDLASVYTAWAEMELRHENYDKALEVRPHLTITKASGV